MKKTILTFGLIAGLIMSVMMVAMLPFIKDTGFDKGEIIGYTTMILSFLLIFFGTRSYRDNTLNGSISFGKAFTVGILITVIACILYVITWEVIYFNFFPEFGTVYADAMMEKMKQSGASADELKKSMDQMAEFKKLYDNPLINAAITFIEPFPIGLVITLISSAILKKKPEAAV